MDRQKSDVREDFLTRTRDDTDFRRRLEEEPKAAMSEFGVALPEEVELRVVQDDEAVTYLHIPAAPPEGGVTDEDLAMAQGGTFLSIIVYQTTQTNSSALCDFGAATKTI